MTVAAGCHTGLSLKCVLVDCMIQIIRVLINLLLRFGALSSSRSPEARTSSPCSATKSIIFFAVHHGKKCFDHGNDFMRRCFCPRTTTNDTCKASSGIRSCQACHSSCKSCHNTIRFGSWLVQLCWSSRHWKDCEQQHLLSSRHISFACSWTGEAALSRV